jgi:hypothetical protein
MANEVKVTTEIVINSSVTGITRKSRILEYYESDLSDFDTPEDTGSTTVTYSVTDIDSNISAPFSYALGDILFIKNTGDEYVDIGMSDQGGNKIYFSRLEAGQHMSFPIGSSFTTNMFGRTGQGADTDISVTVVQTG